MIYNQKNVVSIQYQVDHWISDIDIAATKTNSNYPPQSAIAAQVCLRCAYTHLIAS